MSLNAPPLVFQVGEQGERPSTLRLRAFLCRLASKTIVDFSFTFWRWDSLVYQIKQSARLQEMWRLACVTYRETAF